MSTNSYKMTRRDHINLLLRSKFGAKKLRWPRKRNADDFFRFRTIEARYI